MTCRFPKMNILKLIESFDSQPAPWKMTEYNYYSNSQKASFIIDGLEYHVLIERDTDGEYDIGFKLGDDADYMTNTGNQYKVLNTVMDVIRHFINENYDQIEKITFSASKPVSKYEPEESRSREKVYRRLINKNLNSLPGNWSVKENDFSDIGIVRFTLINNA